MSFADTTTCTTSSTPTSCNPSGFFTPSAFGTLNANDQDMGGSGVVVTDSNAGSALVTFDKSGQGYALSPGSLPGYNSTDCSGCEFSGSLTSPASGFSGPCNGGLGGSSTPCDSVFSAVYWNGTLLLWPRLEDLDWCYWNGTAFVCDPQTGKPGDGLSPSGFPGGSLTVSSTSEFANGIAWGILNPGGANPYVEPDKAPSDFSGHLRAYELNTAPSSSTPFGVTLLWTSLDQWLGAVFALPIVANGNVYVPTYDSGVLVYHP